MTEQQGYWQQDDKSTMKGVFVMVGVFALLMTGVAIGISMVL